jgi:hypothetical protein
MVHDQIQPCWLYIVVREATCCYYQGKHLFAPNSRSSGDRRLPGAPCSSLLNSALPCGTGRSTTSSSRISDAAVRCSDDVHAGR